MLNFNDVLDADLIDLILGPDFDPTIYFSKKPNQVLH